jgi:hypothetical protein
MHLRLSAARPAQGDSPDATKGGGSIRAGSSSVPAIKRIGAHPEPPAIWEGRLCRDLRAGARNPYPTGSN